MACYHPLKGFAIGTTASGKTQYKITSFKADHVEQYSDGKWRETTEKFLSPYAKRAVMKYIEIPCGKCIGCRLAYSRQWADRCMLELQQHSDACFITLTYDDAHLPLVEYADPDTGVMAHSATLVKKDMQAFIKRLRARIEPVKVKYFLCGEYGSDTFRPHYHMILFGYRPPDLQFYKRSSQGFNYYTSPLLSDVWHHKGYVVVTEVSWETCAYTARYIMKKQYGSGAEMYERLNIVPEFTMMSLKPAIGKEYFDAKGEELYNYDHITVPSVSGARRIRAPRYYDRLFDVTDPDRLRAIKADRKARAEDMVQLKLSKTSLDYEEMLEVEENVLLKKTKVFKERSVSK